jgi:hypothetical protein
MRRSLTVFLWFAASVFSTDSAYAQDTRSFGVTMGYPASIGVLWHLTENVALRPELGFNHTSSETETTSPIGVNTSSDGNFVATGISALFHFARWDMTRAYVVPRYAYSRSTASISGPFTGTDVDQTATAHAFGVSFGAQHGLGERFAIYGELGLSYETSATEALASELRRNTVGTRSGVGVVVYF